jgi:hypothetical protein
MLDKDQKTVGNLHTCTEDRRCIASPRDTLLHRKIHLDAVLDESVVAVAVSAAVVAVGEDM